MLWMDIGVSGAEGVFGNEEMQGNGGITRSILQMEKLRQWGLSASRWVTCCATARAEADLDPRASPCLQLLPSFACSWERERDG